MNTSNTFTVGQEVTFANAFGVNIITGIKGNTATTKELNSGATYTKRISSLKPYTAQVAYWSEQELAHGQSKHNHGDVVFTTLSSDGNGGRMLWDDIKKDCVKPQDLTKI